MAQLRYKRRLHDAPAGNRDRNDVPAGDKVKPHLHPLPRQKFTTLADHGIPQAQETCPRPARKRTLHKMIAPLPERFPCKDFRQIRLRRSRRTEVRPIVQKQRSPVLADLLRHALTSGIGHGKGFGCGLLTLALLRVE